ncbi:hypothetical protein [Actinoplanes sp. TFC3]|uniref:hypothetical protein n=1 Tax=Actinoplanes sp. TFC3 TaxID=1710355 RepID=UPI001379652F|nr:hypothetical protein [Actinoplanes sp. TFC3]
MFIAGTAFAYWTTSGAGTGTSATGTSTAVTVTQIGTPPSGLTPGGADQPLAFRVNNSQTTSQYVSAVRVDVASVTTGGGAPVPGCTSADFAITQPTAINSDLTAGDHDYNPSGALIHMINRNVSQDACKDVTVNLSFTAS